MFLLKKKSNNKEKLDIPDFYIASTETSSLQMPRKCHPIKRIKGTVRDDYMLIEINPSYNLNGKKINKLIIASRWEKTTLFPINEWGQYVYVLYPKKGDPESLEIINDQNVDMFAWAEIHKDEKSALEATKYQRENKE